MRSHCSNGSRAVRVNLYNITFGAFYNSDRVEIEPVTNGEALYVVYDLSTSTIHEVPRFAGVPVLEKALSQSLKQFFEPLPTAKRFKVGDDAWRKINEFVVDHRFVYPVSALTLDDLRGTDRLVADRLAAFCDQSGGEYHLYFAELECSRSSRVREQAYLDSRAKYKATLSAPWVRYGTTTGIEFPTVTVDECVELAPAGYLETVHYEEDEETEDDEEDSEDDDPFFFGFGSRNYSTRTVRMQRHYGNTLVIQPATMELALWAKMPVDEVLVKLRELVKTHTEQASLLAQKVSKSKQQWPNRDVILAELLQIAIAVRNVRLFCDLLYQVESFEFDGTVMPRALRQFGWDACIETIVRFMRECSFRTRVNLVCSLLHESANPHHIQALVELLTRLEPWSAPAPPVPVNRSLNPYAARRSSNPVSVKTDPSVEELTRLFALTHRASPATVTMLLNETHSNSTMYSLVIPSFVRFIGELPVADRSLFLPLAQQLHLDLESALPALRNASYAKCKIPDHCDTCRVLQSFAKSPARQISIYVKNKAHLKHIETVIKRKVVAFAGGVTITEEHSNAVLAKVGTSRSVAAEQCLALLASLIP